MNTNDLTTEQLFTLAAMRSELENIHNTDVLKRTILDLAKTTMIMTNYSKKVTKDLIDCKYRS